MTKTQAIQLVAVAVSCFPSMQEKDMELTSEGWFQMLGDLEYHMAMTALKKVLATAKYFPSVAEIREAASSLLPVDVPPAEEAWTEFLHQKRSHGYHDAPQSMRSPGDNGVLTFREPWDFSHPVIGATIKAMYGSWKGCYEVMQDETLGVDRKHFSDMYKTLTKRERERALLPPAVRELTDQLGHVLRLPTSQRKAEVNES